MTVIRLNCKGRDLSARLAESVAVVEQHGPEWAAEVARARRLYEYCTLIHPKGVRMNVYESIHQQLEELLAKYQHKDGSAPPRRAQRLMSDDGGLPTIIPCEAITYSHGLLAAPGTRCNATPAKLYDNHALCWVHRQAQRNPSRNVPLQYADKP